jgi:poly(hydroxyalkanoate) depolymerase family esterase
MWQQFTYQNADGSFPYFVFTPESYTVETPAPLFVMLHGCSQTALDFATGTGMNLLAEQYGFLVVYPQQVRDANQGLCWNWFLPANQQRGSGEPARIVGIVEQVQQNTASWNIDPARIYVAGISAGAAMSVILGATYPDVFAAIGAHSGLEFQAASGLSQGLNAMRRGGPDPNRQGNAAFEAMGALTRIVPTIVFHGTADTVVAPINGDQVVQQWMLTDHLASNNTYNADYSQPSSMSTGQIPGGYAYITALWNEESGETVQTYWKIDGMGHAWSGGNLAGTFTDPRGPSASQAMYDFFMAHPIQGSGQSQEQTNITHLNLRRILADLFKIRREHFHHR